ncbi:MAG: MOSC domain-containing protein [Veillonellaceae bacterium]|jgi:MOSC domain-containing protein YiiM|nr:MOSC domain-containing protein [Veillonellaceae bacterium]
MQGRIVAVCTSKSKGERKVDVGTALLIEGLGMAGDAHAGFAHRQISLLSVTSIEKMKQKCGELAPGDFAENLTVSGLDLPALPVGTVLRVGEVVLKVSQIGKECHQGCAVMQAVGDCVMPREGIFATVEKGGRVSNGDAIEIIAHV